MHAIEVRESGGPEVLRNVEKPAPSPGPGEVLIKAEAIGVNFVDTYFRSGSYPHELPFVLGTEVGGTVEALGDGVTELRGGERVATADAVGAYAEYCFAPANVAASVPAGVSTDVAAAGAGSVYLTRPSRPNFMRRPGEFAWRTDELFRSITAGTIDVTVGQHYPLGQAALAHRDLEDRKTIGSTVLEP
jgi:NADPH:quinone reductase-like Zn-dependent oxidoreductase